MGCGTASRSGNIAAAMSGPFAPHSAERAAPQSEEPLKSNYAIVALAVLAACTDGTAGPPPGSRSISMNTVADGVTGTALMTKETTARSTVWVTLRGMAQGVTYTGYIARGTCQSPGTVAVTLNALTANGAVGSVTTRSVPDSVLSAGYYLYYAKPGLPPPPVACGNLN